MAKPAARVPLVVKLLTAVVFVAPLLVFVAIGGISTGQWDWTLGYTVLTMRWGWWAALAGGVAAMIVLLLALRNLKTLWPWALLAVVVAGVTITLYGMEFRRFIPEGPAADVTTNVGDPPGFARGIMDRREAAGARSVARAPGVDDRCVNPGSLPFQAAPEAASVALQRAGFRVLGRGVGRSDGTREVVWFKFGYDATIRIRPGQTDVRVASRETRDDGGEACRLLNRIAAELQSMR